MDINLRSVDLNLLTIFESLMQTKNLSHSAQELGMTQPAVSHALKRLQKVYDDPLFVRKERKMEPTDKAIAMFPIIQNTLMDIRSTLPIKGIFNPQNIELTFKINIQNLDVYPFIIEFTKQLKCKAPNITLKISNVLLEDKEKALRNREYDLDIDVLPTEHPACQSKVLFEDSISVFVSKTHPRLGHVDSLSEAQFFNEEHAVIAKTSAQSYPLEKLSEIFKKRKVGFVASRFNDIYQVVRDTDFIAVMPTNHFDSLLENHQIQCLPFPFDMQLKLPIMLTWHSNVQYYKPHSWCRNLLMELMKQKSLASK